MYKETNKFAVEDRSLACPFFLGRQFTRLFLMLGICCFSGTWMLELGFSQSPVLGNVKNFNLSEYFEAPHQTRMKWELTSASAQGRTNGTYLLKEMRIEMYREDGRREFVVIAPECIYDTAKQQASSAGPLELQSGDGQFVTTGEGFLWNQADQNLRISNHVQTVVRELPKTKSKR